MRTSAICPSRGVFGAVATCIVGTLAAAVTASPTAEAAPANCTASGLANTASSVLGSAGGYLDSHPGANDVLTAAVSQSQADARSSVRGYFAAHPNELFDLNNIAQPLRDLRKQCNVSMSLPELATLADALSH